MNKTEYEAAIDSVVDNLSKEIHKAAKRNSHKDIESWLPDGTPATWILGWEGYNMKHKLVEEFIEYIEKPSRYEIGDIGWVLAMLLDNRINGENNV